MSKELDRFNSKLQDVFFAQTDAVLAAELESAISEGEHPQKMVDAFDVADEQVVQQLKALGLGDKTLAAISLVPLIQVAWADGKLQDNERKALFDAALQHGFKEWSPSFRIFKTWLRSPPPSHLAEAWKAYMRALTAEFDREQKDFVKQQFLDRAERIAAAAGGILLRIGSISEAEQAVLDDLASVFD